MADFQKIQTVMNGRVSCLCCKKRGHALHKCVNERDRREEGVRVTRYKTVTQTRASACIMVISKVPWVDAGVGSCRHSVFRRCTICK